MLFAQVIALEARISALQEFKLQNIVGSCDVKFPIRLEGLAFAHEKFCSVSRLRLYNPVCLYMTSHRCPVKSAVAVLLVLPSFWAHVLRYV